MITFERVTHRLALAVVVIDHFTKEPISDELAVELDSREQPLRNVDRTGYRHADGSYRFLAPVTTGNRQLRVTGDRYFTWSATTTVAVPRPDPSQPVTIEAWPKANAPVAPPTLAIRGSFQAIPPAAPVANGQRVEIEVEGATARNRFTRSDEVGDFLFIVRGAADIDATTRTVDLLVRVPGRNIASIRLVEGTVVTTVPGTNPITKISVRPGREIRALIHLS